MNLDSELVVRQITGEYKVRETHLKPLHRQALELLGSSQIIRSCTFPAKKTAGPTNWPMKQSTRKSAFEGFEDSRGQGFKGRKILGTI